MITVGVGDVTTLVGQVGDRDSPSLRVRASTLNIFGNLVASEPPERDLGLIPEHSSDATASLVERAASTSLEILDGTTGIIICRGRTLETKWVSKKTLRLITILALVPSGDVRVYLTFPVACTGVQCVLVGRCRVHVLDNVNLMGWEGCRSTWLFMRDQKQRNPLTSPLSGQLGLEGRGYGSTYHQEQRWMVNEPKGCRRK